MYLGTTTLNASDERLAHVMAHECSHAWTAVHSVASNRLRAMIKSLTDQNPEEASVDCVRGVIGYGSDARECGECACFGAGRGVFLLAISNSSSCGRERMVRERDPEATATVS